MALDRNSYWSGYFDALTDVQSRLVNADSTAEAYENAMQFIEECLKGE